MAKAHGENGFAYQVCESLGLDKNLVYGATLVSKVGDVDTVVVELYADYEKTNLETKEYELVPKE